MANTSGARKTLSAASEYEQIFGVRHRPPGRPSRAELDEPLFPRGDVPDLVGRVAERRAYAVVHEKHRAELASIYRAELKVLLRRGEDAVRADIRSGVAS